MDISLEYAFKHPVFFEFDYAFLLRTEKKFASLMWIFEV